MSVRVGDEIVAGGQGDMYTKAQVDALIANAIAQTTEKPGMIKPFAGTTVPTGYLLCDGSAVSRTTYANLFSAIGTTYGSGDGSTTFNLPDLLQERCIIGSSDIGSTTSGAAPKISGVFGIPLSPSTHVFFDNYSGCFYNGSSTSFTANYLQPSSSTFSSVGANRVWFDASRNSSVYWKTDNKIRPAGVMMRYFIKY